MSYVNIDLSDESASNGKDRSEKNNKEGLVESIRQVNISSVDGNRSTNVSVNKGPQSMTHIMEFVRLLENEAIPHVK